MSTLCLAFCSTLMALTPRPTDQAPAFVATSAAVVDHAAARRDTIPVTLLEQRREALLELMEPGIAIVPSAEPYPDWEHPQASDFRQDNDFYYLTGLETPDSWLVLFKSENGDGKVLLYLPERDPNAELWIGPQVGAGPEASRLTGIEAVRSVNGFAEEVVHRLGEPGDFAEFPRVYLPLGGDPSRTRALVEAAASGQRPTDDLDRPLAALRQVKDRAELASLRRAIDITVEAQLAAMKAAQPGIYEYELEARVEYVFRSRGAQRVGFPSIVGSGPNSVILHHDTNRRQTEDGDLVVLDIGAEFDYYTADITRTFPVNGVFSERQRAVYELVLATQQVAIDSVRPGLTILDLERIARGYMRKHSEAICGGSSCERYFVHGLSHWLGMDVHDVGDYSRPLAPGMVLTVEPGIYLADEALGVRIEDDVLVTESGHEVLSAAAPKTIEAIEALMKR